MEWMIMPLKRYAEFSGRSRRKEYWMFFLFNILVGIGFAVVSVIVGGSATAVDDPTAGVAAGGARGIITILNLLFSLAMLIPSIAVGVRRLHDTDRSGWWLLAPLGPYLIGIVAMVAGGFSILGSGGSPTAGLGAAMAVGGLFLLVGLIAAIALIVFFCIEGTRGPNRFGPDPKDTQNSLGDVFS